MKTRVFGGGSPATGEPAELTITADSIQIRTDSGLVSARIPELRVRQIGTDLAGIELAWETAAGLRAVQVLDPAGAREVGSHPALENSPQFAALRGRRRRQNVGRSAAWTVLGVVVLFPLLLFLVFIWQSDRIAGAAAARIPIDQEVKLGDHTFAQMRASLDLQDSGPAYDAVKTLGQRLTRGSKYTYRFHVAKNETVNAFALPGGIVVVHTGLINATRRAEELAGVLAHEVQHVELRHSLRAVVKDLGLRGLWMLVTGDIGSGVLGRAALELTSLTFSRDAEAEADQRGFDVLVANGIDPSGVSDFFIVMAEKAGPTPPPLLSTHPASADRERALRERVKALQQRFTPLDLKPWPPT
ncbi:MAG: M48 family metallopeptidase [Steroidobacteraceae bacterium]